MRYFWLLVFFIPLNIIAQPFDGKGKENVQLNEPFEVQQLLEDHAAFLEELKTFRGYRIELQRSKDLKNVEQQKAGFEMNYSGLPTYLIWDQVYYRLKVGNFTSRMEALRWLQRIKEDYPDAYIVIDQVHIFPED